MYAGLIKVNRIIVSFVDDAFGLLTESGWMDRSARAVLVLDRSKPIAEVPFETLHFSSRCFVTDGNGSAPAAFGRIGCVAEQLAHVGQRLSATGRDREASRAADYNDNGATAR